MANESFSQTGNLRPDWSAPTDWSGGQVPGAGTAALINAVDVLVDPGTTLAANITLAGGGGLIGNESGFVLGATANLQAQDHNALDANGAIINYGNIAVTGGANLAIVVQAGSEIAASYGLREPSFENAGGIIIADAGTLDLSGTEFSNIGTVQVDDGVLSVAGGWVDGGQGAATPGGTIEISRGGIAIFADGVTDQTIIFDGPGTLVLNDPVDLHDVVIKNFRAGDEIRAPSKTAAQTMLQNLQFSGLPAASQPSIEALANGAAIILASAPAAPCFARGTRLRTPSGYTPVEQLNPGDTLLTQAGQPRKLRWVGWRTIDLATHPRLHAVQPVCMTAGALVDDVPCRDVVLSPDHGLLLNGVLVPVKLLVNGVTIRRLTTLLAVTYFHVELAQHEILLAENLPVESYLDTGNRNMFSNAAGQAWAAPVFGRGKQWNHLAAAELCLSGPVLRDIRASIAARLHAQGYRVMASPEISLTMDGRHLPRASGSPVAPGFRLTPGHGGMAVLQSNHFVPAEFYEDAAVDDYRSLGIALRRLKFDYASHHPTAVIHTGLHPASLGDCAVWTNGAAHITVPAQTSFLGLSIQAYPKTWMR